MMKLSTTTNIHIEQKKPKENWKSDTLVTCSLCEKKQNDEHNFGQK